MKGFFYFIDIGFCGFEFDFDIFIGFFIFEIIF